MSNIRVFLADDQPIVRRGIALVLLEDPSIDVVGEAGDGCETIESVQLLSPHVVLMDIDMPGISGLEATKRIKDALPDVAVLILTIHERETSCFKPYRRGRRDTSSRRLTFRSCWGRSGPSIPARCSSIPEWRPCWWATTCGGMKRDNGQDQYRRLSAREREVLPLLAESHTNQEIAHLLHLFMLSTPTSRGESIIRQGERSWR